MSYIVVNTSQVIPRNRMSNSSFTLKLGMPRTVNHITKSPSSCFFWCLLVISLNGLWNSVTLMLIAFYSMMQSLSSTVFCQFGFIWITFVVLVPFLLVCDNVRQLPCFNDMTYSFKLKSKLSDLEKHLIIAIFHIIQKMHCSSVEISTALCATTCCKSWA